MSLTCGFELCVLECDLDSSTPNALKVVLEVSCQNNRLDRGKARQLRQVHSPVKFHNVVKTRGVGGDALIDLHFNASQINTFTKASAQA